MDEPGPDSSPAAGGRRPATIHEVARRAGVSHQTVSRYLKGRGGLRPETVTRVSQAIEELDYRPNLAARSMRTRRSGRIVAVLPDATGFVPTRMLTGAAAAAHEAGFLLDVVGLEGDAVARAERIRTLLHPDNVDAVLSFAPLAQSMAELGSATSRIPLVVEGEYDDKMRARGILADATPAAEIVTRLARLGHERLAHVGGPPQWASARNRRSVYEATVRELGLESRLVVEGEWTVGSGWDAARTRIAGSGVTAVFAANDQIALGVIRGLQSLGIDVPGEVSVFGWDDDEVGRYFNPTLSTVSVDRERQGREAVGRLLALLRGEPTAPAVAPAALNRVIVRESTGPAPRP